MSLESSWWIVSVVVDPGSIVHILPPRPLPWSKTKEWVWMMDREEAGWDKPELVEMSLGNPGLVETETWVSVSWNELGSNLGPVPDP